MTKPLAGNLVFDDIDFDTQLLRTLGHIYDKGADFGECMATAFKILDGDRESWHQAWFATAERLSQLGHKSLLNRHAVSGRRALLRACEYYRVAEYFLRTNLSDPRSRICVDKMQECFTTALELMPKPTHIARFQIDNTDFEYYFLAGNADNAQARTLVFVGGYDTFAEEMYFSGGRAALARGHNVVLFDGPGQGKALRRDQHLMRPDWENVMAPLLASLGQFSEVDPQRVALIGRNLGGFLVARTATVLADSLAAVVLDPGQYDLGLTLKQQLSEPLLALQQQGDTLALDREMMALFNADPHLAYFFLSRMGAHALTTPSDYLSLLDQYRIDATAIAQITCPTALCLNADDRVAVMQSQVLQQQLPSAAKIFEFSAEDGAGDGSELGAAALFYLLAYDWLEEVMP